VRAHHCVGDSCLLTCTSIPNLIGHLFRVFPSFCLSLPYIQCDISVAVASEAYSKRYKGILEETSFMQAVMRYRNRMKHKYFARAWPEAQSPLQAQNLTQIQPQALAVPSNVRFQSDLPSTSAELQHRVTSPSDQDSEGGEGSHQPSEREQNTDINVIDPNLHAQHLLEALPRQVLSEARSFQEYVRYLGGFYTNDSFRSGSGTQSNLCERLKPLLDDVVRMDGMKQNVEVEILRDKGNVRVSLPCFFFVLDKTS
jgi:potassium channel subfamily K